MIFLGPSGIVFSGFKFKGIKGMGSVTILLTLISIPGYPGILLLMLAYFSHLSWET